jgi:hypothetical protein
MAVQTGSNVLRNPFANARVDAPNFNEPGKRSPTDGSQQRQPGDQQQQVRSPTDLTQNDGFQPDLGKDNGDNKPKVDSNDPMSGLDNLWDDVPVDPKAPVKKDFKGYLPDIDPTKFAEQVGQVDFAGKIDPKHFQAVAKGGDEAIAAMAEIVNQIGRNTFSMSFNAASKMANAGFSNVESRFMNDLIPNSINNRIVDDTVTSGNELARDPKYAPMFRSVKEQFARKYQKATPQQIAEATNQYMQRFVTDATKSKTPAQDDNTTRLKKGDGNADWMEWIAPELK